MNPWSIDSQRRAAAMEVGAGSSSSTAAPPAGGDCSSCSGTLSSTNTPIGSPSSSSSSFGLHPPGMDLDAEARASKLRHLKDLLQEFGCNCNAALERWFSDMDADGILHLAGHDDDDAAAATRSIVLVSPQLPHLARRWILALRSIKDSTFAYIHGLCSEEEDGDNDTPTDDAQPTLAEFSRFIESAISKMLPFADAIAALESSSSSEHIVTAAETKLQALVPVRDALFTASEEIRFWPPSSSTSLSSRALERIVDDMGDLLSSKLGELDKAIWDTTEEIRTGIMDDGGAVAFLSPDIHDLTRSVIGCIKLLDTNHVLFSRIAYEAAQLGTLVPETGRDILPLTSLVLEMLSRLERKLAAMSRAFQDRSLRFLFLINNSHFIWQQLHLMFDMRFAMAALNRKIDGHIQSYLQVSWGPVLACLHHDPIPGPLLRLRFGRPPDRFQSEFHKVYATQRLWKVPDPEMRPTLRKAIADMITSGLQAKCTLPEGELEEMLQELFEG